MYEWTFCVHVTNVFFHPAWRCSSRKCSQHHIIPYCHQWQSPPSQWVSDQLYMLFILQSMLLDHSFYHLKTLLIQSAGSAASSWAANHGFFSFFIHSTQNSLHSHPHPLLHSLQYKTSGKFFTLSDTCLTSKEHISSFKLSALKTLCQGCQTRGLWDGLKWLARWLSDFHLEIL